MGAPRAQVCDWSRSAAFRALAVQLRLASPLAFGLLGVVTSAAFGNQVVAGLVVTGMDALLA
jgi:hypothetical protein